MSKLQTRVQTKLVRNMSADEIEQCRRLHIHRNKSRIVGDLNHHLRYYRSGAKVTLLKRADGRVLSWGLVDFTDGPRPVVQLYTHWRWRRRGFGARVLQAIRKLLASDNFVHFKHDTVSSHFFTSQLGAA